MHPHCGAGGGDGAVGVEPSAIVDLEVQPQQALAGGENRLSQGVKHSRSGLESVPILSRD